MPQSKGPDIDLLQRLLQHNTDLLDAGDVFKRTPLLIAASKGDFLLFKCLARVGANLQSRDASSRSQEYVPLIILLFVERKYAL
jgi:ankyrin repeat protein